MPILSKNRRRGLAAIVERAQAYGDEESLYALPVKVPARRDIVVRMGLAGSRTGVHRPFQRVIVRHHDGSLASRKLPVLFNCSTRDVIVSQPVPSPLMFTEIKLWRKCLEAHYLRSRTNDNGANS